MPFKSILKTLLFLFLGLITSISAAEKMTSQEYQTRLKSSTARNEKALPRIAQLKAKILDIKDEIETVEGDSRNVWRDILDLVGISQPEYDAFVTSVENLQSTVAGYQSQFSQDFSNWERGLAEAEGTLRQLKSKSIAAIPRVERMFPEVEGALSASRNDLRLARDEAANRIASQRAEKQNARENREKREREYAQAAEEAAQQEALASPVSEESFAPETNTYAGSYESTGESYTVNPGNSLWRIARMPENGGNPNRWKAIFRANQDKISDPNLIFPGMV